MLNIQKYISCFDNIAQANLYLKRNFRIDVIEDTVLSQVDGSWYATYVYVPKPTADLKDPIVREANCLILDEDGELIAKAADIAHELASLKEIPQDFNLEGARVFERTEGVLLTVYNIEGEWFVGSQFSVDAREEPFEKTGYLSYGSQFKDYLEAKADARMNWYERFQNVDPRLCFVFQYLSPQVRGRIFPIMHKELVLLDIINKADGKPLPQSRVDGIANSWKMLRPPYRSVQGISSLSILARNMPVFRTGLTVISKDERRIEIANPIYKALYNAKAARGRIEPTHVVKIVSACRDSVDFMQVEKAFPEYRDIMQITKEAIDRTWGELYTLWNHAKRHVDDKPFAKEVMHHPLNYLLFMFKHGKINSIKDAVEGLPAQKIVELMRVRDDKELSLKTRCLRIDNGGGND